MSNQIRAAEKILRESGLADIMRIAYKAHIIIPAFNIPYLPMVKPVVSALKAAASFGLVEVALPDIASFGAQSFGAVQQEFRKHADTA